MTITRRQHGRGHVYEVNGKRYPGVTTILRSTLAKDALVGWAARTTAEYALDHWADLDALRPSERLKLMTGASNAQRDAAAVRGTAVHRLADQIVTSADHDAVAVPDDLAAYVDSYLAFIADHQPEPIATELVVANRHARYCGTADLVAIMRGATWLLELKTSKGLRSDSALQACAYRHGEVYTLPGDEGRERPLAELGITRTGVVHIRAGGYDLRPLDTGPTTWDYFKRLAWLYHHADRAEGWVGEAIQPARALAS